jgi:localization factor PodJL
VRLNSDAQLQRAIAAATQAVQKELHEIRDIELRMKAALAEAQAEIQASARMGFEDGQARAEIEGLSQRLDDLKADAASERDVHSLRVAVEQISARVAQGADFRPLAEMEKRLGDISDRLERASEETLNVAPQIAELEQRIASLDQKLMKLLTENGEINAWPAIEPQLSALVDRLGQTETQLSNLANLDQSIGQLFERVEESRNWSREVADEAANRMAARLSEMQHSSPLAPVQEVNALTQGLDAMRASSAQVDKRNQETFAAIHDALAQVIARLNDGDWAGAAKTSSAATPAPIPEPAPVLPMAADLPAFTPPHIPPLDSFAAEPAQPRMSPLVTPMPEPEMPEPVLPGPPMPAARAPEAPAADENLPNDDFIAAARRAAQAASQQSSGPLNFLSRAKAKPEKAARSKFSLRLGRKKPEAPAAAAAAAAEVDVPGTIEVLPAPPAPDAGRRRKLLLVGIVLLAAASALAFGTMLRSAKKAPAPPPASSSQFIPFIGEVSKPVTVATKDMAPAAIEESKPKDTIASMVDAMITAALPAPSEQEPAANIAKPVLPDAIGTPSLRKAALDGNALAQFVIASRFLDGDGVTANPALAAEWYRKAADQGLAPAQYRLGTLYERGKGVTRNMAMARDWYERAAEGGNVRAMHNAAVIYAGAQAGTPGYQKAARWFEAAALYGLRDSQYNLAILYERGMGVEKNAAQAMFWYGVAARQSDPDAAVRVKSIARDLAEPVKAETQAKIDNFQAKPMDELANRVTLTDADWQAPGSIAGK